MTQYLGSNKKESRAIYWLRYIRKGMELPKDMDLLSFEYAKKIAHLLHKRGYQGEIIKVRQEKDYIGWAYDDSQSLWNF